MYYGEEMSPLWNEPDEPSPWMSLGDDMSEDELRDAAAQQRADARWFGPLNDEPYMDRSSRVLAPGETPAAAGELRVRRLRISQRVRDAVAAHEESLPRRRGERDR